MAQAIESIVPAGVSAFNHAIYELHFCVLSTIM